MVKYELRPREEVRMHNLSIPMLQTEKDAVRKKASECGMTMAAYARWVLVNAAKKK